MSTAEQPLLTPRQYLDLERVVDTKHEFFHGETFAMSGASRNHNRINVNLARRLAEQFDNGPCEVFANDMRVKVESSGLYTYPDIAATCDQPKFEDMHVDTLLNPQLLIETISESTEKYDRGSKFSQYRNIASLKDYVLVSQNDPRVEVFSRQEDGSWLMRVTDSLSESVTIPSTGTRLQMKDIYARVEMSSQPLR